jgi:hypothetical protein
MALWMVLLYMGCMMAVTLIGGALGVGIMRLRAWMRAHGSEHSTHVLRERDLISHTNS